MEPPASPATLGRMVWGQHWGNPPHLVMLDNALVDVMAGRIKRLMVTLPPRHAKSTMCSHFFPACYLGHYPDKRFMLASYQADFAASWGRKARQILTEYGPQFYGVHVAKSPSAIDNWEIEDHKGGMVTAGAGGALTGKGADVCCIDDPHKGAEEANSYVIREKIWDWYRSVAYTRLEPNGAVVIVMTRWHNDDLGGRVLRDAEETNEQWTHINMPAIAEDNDPLGRPPGTALWSERFDEEKLANIKRVVGEYVWEALYQQRPPSQAGRIFDPAWFKYFTRRADHYFLWNDRDCQQQTCRVPEKECERFCIVDCAATSEEEAAARKGKPPSDSVVTTFDFFHREGYLMVRDCCAGKWSFPDLLAVIQRQHNMHHHAWIGVESEKTGKAVLSTLRALPMRPIDHENKDKLARSSRAQNQMQQGKIFFDKEAPWRHVFETQLTRWTGAQDEKIDMGDTLFYACLHCGDRTFGTLVIPGVVFKL